MSIEIFRQWTIAEFDAQNTYYMKNWPTNNAAFGFGSGDTVHHIHTKIHIISLDITFD